MDRVIAETTETAKTDVCSIYLLEPDGEALLLTATNGLSQAPSTWSARDRATRI